MRVRWIRASIVIFLIGAAYKILLIRLWMLIRGSALLTTLTFEPLPVWFADRTTALFFETKGIAPEANATIAWPIFMVVGSGLEFLIFGLFMALVRVRALYRKSE